MNPTRPGYLRVSVTARCNLHCVYCRPPGVRASCEPGPEPTCEDISVLVECAAAEGVRKIRITGGEPLLRGDLEQIVRCVSATAGIHETTLTTNGIGLARRARRLKEAGLDRINISLDTMHPDRFASITGHGRHQDVLEGIDAAARTFKVVKLNAVLLKGVNDDEIETLVAFAARNGLWLRFIECYSSRLVPTPAHAYVSAEEVKDRLRRAFGPLERVGSSMSSVEETYVLTSVGGAKVGVIASVTHPRCMECAKLRFTASGELRACLFDEQCINLVPLLKRKDRPAIRAAIRKAYTLKSQCRPRAFATLPLPVFCIGG